MLEFCNLYLLEVCYFTYGVFCFPCLQMQKTGEVGDEIAAAQADDTSENVAEPAGYSDISEDKNNTADKAQNFPCPIRDFVSSWANGLHIHMTKKHANLEQVDGKRFCA